jgi:hypothetical protein
MLSNLVTMPVRAWAPVRESPFATWLEYNQPLMPMYLSNSNAENSMQYQMHPAISTQLLVLKGGGIGFNLDVLVEPHKDILYDNIFRSEARLFPLPICRYDRRPMDSILVSFCKGQRVRQCIPS